jgi:hypothetical protein
MPNIAGRECPTQEGFAPRFRERHIPRERHSSWERRPRRDCVETRIAAGTPFPRGGAQAGRLRHHLTTIFSVTFANSFGFRI